jgi:hypothetical protein
MARALQITVAAIAFLAAGCGGDASQPQPQRHPTTAAIPLTRLQACQRLLADIRRNGGAVDLRALRDVADHVADPRLAADARTLFRDLAHENVSPLGLLLLQDDCAKAGVRLPVP